MCRAGAPIEFFNLEDDLGELENGVGDLVYEDVIRYLSGSMDVRYPYLQ